MTVRFFLQRHFLLQISSILFPWVISLQPTAVLALACSPIPTLQLRLSAHQYTCISAQVCYQWHGVQTVCVVLTLSRLSQISCFTLLQQPNASLLSQLISPNAIIHSYFSSPNPGVQVPSHCLLFSLLTFVYPVVLGSIWLPGWSGPWLVFSQCSVRTVVSVDRFLMHLWRDALMTTAPSLCHFGLIMIF